GRTSLRVMRPPSPVPCTSLASSPYSPSSRRTTGDISWPPVGGPTAGAGAGPEEGGGVTGSRARGGGVGAGAAGGGGGGTGSRTRGGGVGAGAAGGGVAGSRAGGADAPAPPAPSAITARRVPTSAVSPS